MVKRIIRTGFDLNPALFRERHHDWRMHIPQDMPCARSMPRSWRRCTGSPICGAATTLFGARLWVLCPARRQGSQQCQTVFVADGYAETGVNTEESYVPGPGHAGRLRLSGALHRQRSLPGGLTPARRGAPRGRKRPEEHYLHGAAGLSAARGRWRKRDRRARNRGRRSRRRREPGSSLEPDPRPGAHAVVLRLRSGRARPGAALAGWERTGPSAPREAAVEARDETEDLTAAGEISGQDQMPRTITPRCRAALLQSTLELPAWRTISCTAWRAISQ